MTTTYRITTEPQKTMFGKRTGAVLARLESDWSANVASATGQTASAAKAALLDYLGHLASNDERAYLYCGDNQTMLVVSFAGNSWQYDILSRDRQVRSGCIMPNVASFKEAIAHATAHADQSYGGVVKTL